MDYIFSPWRYQYIATANREKGCIFCKVVADNTNEQDYIVFRASLNFIILNLFPYSSGHLMIVPYKHERSLALLDQPTTTEMIELSKKAQTALESEYHPDGFNIGINLGHAAGAGVAEHVHMHVVPRWTGDANFMSVIGETRVLPEELKTTYRRLSVYF
ncbi:MAG: HIT domain-containing protein [Candidatus Melainabacteria bacterium]|nr:HIT domain-containing protein [Candidatus Melainabacteria bacterium]